ncbi:hypothetical protein Ddye_007487 [Dipteronia dyeriana]|uniref:Uncharacterized protein n=1 Tax=Dipteronia dyeriana TaxID=168575 RepID=A0AAE0CRQ6_9ROSI|nr:hypothetical protein Ddye_007487 [Dipteronia dyeriana]
MKTNYYFALIGNWSSIAKNKKNRLKKGCMVTLWSFRMESELFLALVKVRKLESDSDSSDQFFMSKLKELVSMIHSCLEIARTKSGDRD